MAETEENTLSPGEPHPGAEYARNYLLSLNADTLMIWQESFSSCAVGGNHLGSICSETLRRLLDGEPVSDRYIMGLAWVIWSMEKDK